MTNLLSYRELPATDLSTVILDVHIARTSHPIGTIRWSVPWRQYAYEPRPGTAYTRAVLIEIRRKLARLMWDWAKTQPATPHRGKPIKASRTPSPLHAASGASR